MLHCIFVSANACECLWSLLAKLPSQAPCACLQKFINTPNYAALGAEDKAARLEQGICPSFGLSGCDELLFMNFAADWDLLKPALEAAFTYDSPEHQAGGFKTILN